MCGFAGVVTWDEKYRVTRDTLQKMSRAIAHRGPDGEGFHLTREHEPITPESPQVGLAFRRLAILDPDPRSNQPFHLGSLTLVFNGEIYNFRELRKELSQLRPDHEWRTTGDTEVLLMAYEVWREKCVEKLNGMFAFAVWDEQKKELFLARDRMGQKPLYVAEARQYEEGPVQATAFSSDINGLRALGWADQRFDERGLFDYLKFGFLLRTTMCIGIEQIGPARMRHYSPGYPTGQVNRDYFRHTVRGPLEKAQQRMTADERTTETRRIVRGSVSRQLVSDVPLGCFLSGGIDSSVIALCMKAALPKDHRVLTFTVAFEDPRYNEATYAAAVARHLGTDHHEFLVKVDAAEDLLRLASAFGEPFGDSSALPTFYLARETKRHVKVALSGDGGDELFGGYDRYRALAITERIHSLPEPFRSIILRCGPRAVAELVHSTHPKSAPARLKRLMTTLTQPAPERYESYLRLFDDSSIAGLSESVSRSTSSASVAASFEYFNRGREAVPAALAADRSSYLPCDLLTKVDRSSMFHGLEVRSPYMDHELIRFGSTLTTDQLLKGGPKRMLREAFAKDLPDFVFKRKKMGFAVPIGEWFRGELRPMLRENLFASNSFGRSHFNMKVVERFVDEHESQRIDHSQRLYALLMLELWWQQQRTVQ